ncbi:rifin [Plasmodium sp. gorilla clade G1]|nr:rifin [Plasmodium sp. gorilla clade G1]
MKLYYSRILLFSLPLNILVSSSYAHSKNKPYITSHTPTTTSRLLIECNIYMPNYDYDPDMNSVRENFHKQTEQRFHEYDERMIKNRQKCKEQYDKDIQEIIVKDKIKKSLVEKVEKGCLKCGCGLGGVATSVGVLGTAVVYVLKKAAMDAAVGDAIADGVVVGEAARIPAAIDAMISGIRSTFSINKLGHATLESIIDANTYTKTSIISGSIYNQYQGSCINAYTLSGADKSICSIVGRLRLVPGEVQAQVSIRENIVATVNEIFAEAERVAGVKVTDVTTKTTAALINEKTRIVQATYMGYEITIIASVIAILVIVLVMVIIYLILRYRRKKK